MARRLGDAILGLASEAGFPPIGAVDPDVLAHPGFAADEALTLRPLGLGAAPLGSWALGLDLYVPQPAATFTSLLQTGDGDGELFLRDNGDGTAGVGVLGVYDGAFAFDAWNRLVVTVTQEAAGTVLRKYLNGAQIGGAQPLPDAARFAVDPAVGLRLLTDNDGETAPGALSGVFFSPVVPSPAEVAGLLAAVPGADAAGFFPVEVAPGAVELDFANADLAPRYGVAEVRLDGFGFRTPVALNDSAFGFASQFGLAGPGGEDAPVLAYADYAPDEGVLLRLPGVVGDLSSYTAVWDVNVAALAGFQALLQTDVAQGGDGELFIRGDGGLGINGDYDGAVAPGAWARIAVTVQDRGDGTATLTKYLDGAFLDSQTVDAARYTLSAAAGFLLLSDNDGETGGGHLAHFGLAAEPLDAAAVAALGGADAAGPFAPAAADPAPLPPTGTGQRTLTLSFDSSFRPFDGMTGEVLASVDGGDFAPLLTLTTANSGGNSSLSRVDERISLEFTVAETAQDVAFAFTLRNAGNDWWWAIDDLALTDESGALIFAESFDALADDLRPAADENIAGLGWTDVPPEGWARENAAGMPQGTTEWQGWSFATPDFWTAADGQNRADFAAATGVIAIADPDEWDDFNGGSQTGADFDSTLTTPAIALQAAGRPTTFQLGFDGYAPTMEFGFAAAEVIDLPTELARQDEIDDLLLRDDGAPVEIDLAAAFGPEAEGFTVTATDGTVVDATLDGATLRLSGLSLGHADLTVTAEVGGATVEERFRAIVAGPNAYVFAIIPDTQDYTSNQTLEDNSFSRMTDWLVDQKDSLSIAHAIHVGDIVQFGAPGQWAIAEDAMERLDGQITYTLAIGNHDQQRPGFASAFSFETDVDAYFTPEQVGATPAQGGGTYDGFDVGPDVFGDGSTYADSIRNHYSTIVTPDGQGWLMMSLEFGMPDDVLRWAGEVIEAHPDHRVVIDTHSWNGGDGRVTPTTEPLNTDNGGWGYAIRENPRGVNDGEDAWRELASKHPNVTFTFNGHNFMGGAETVVSYGPGGDPVHQMFVNYQNGAWRGPEGVGTNGGNGALRLLVIDPDNDRFTTHTKLVEQDAYFAEFPDHEEVFEGVDFGAPRQVALAKAGVAEVVTAEGLTAAVTLDPSASTGDLAGARYAWATADGEVLGETDGEPLTVALPAGVHRLTLQVTHRDGAVSTDDKTVIVAAPGALLTETFDDGDAAGWAAPAAQADDLFTLGTDLGLSLPSLGGAAQTALRLRFDSSFRPFDDQTGEVLVSFDDGATFATLLTLDAASAGGSSSLDRADEAVTLDVLAPGDATSVRFAWRLSEADNDWWWAIDNVVLETADGAPLFAEDFDALPLQGVVDEADPGRAVWTPTPPEDWAQTTAPGMSQGTTEFQGWTFMERDFWVSTAGDQDRSSFTRAAGVVAVADPDEWDDTAPGADGDTNEFDSTLATPSIALDPAAGGAPAPAAGVVVVPAQGPDSAIAVTPTGLSGRIDTYSIVVDLLLSPTAGRWTSLFQTDPTNGGDGEIFFRNDGGTASIGISGDYDGALTLGEWGRVALVFETDATGRQTLAKYLDGALLDTQVVDADVSDGSRWSLDAAEGLLLLADNDGETSEVALNALHFTPEALDAAAIAALGGPDVDGPVAEPGAAGAFQLSFDGALDALDYGEATVAPVSLRPAGDSSYLVKGSIFGNPDGEGEAALWQQSNGAEEAIIWRDGADWRDYVFDAVIEPADNDTVGAVFYYADAENHYRLTMNQQADVRELARVTDGVETVLAREPGSYRHFAPQDLRIAVIDGRITITLDDEALFGGPVVDPAPLAGGTVGFVTGSMDRVSFDDVAVNPVTLAARALTADPGGRWAADLDGDGTARFELTAHASLSADGIVAHEWLVDGEVRATGETVSLDLTPGETSVTLRVTDAAGRTAEDRVTLTAASRAMVLAQDDFSDGDFAGWTVVDEGALDGPSDWAVEGGALVQRSDIGSPQQGTGSQAYSVAGDGPFILRDGTYALRDDPAALAWADYAVEATLTPGDDDGIGLLFRYADAENFYKLEADAQTGLVILTRHLEGRETILARGYDGYTAGEAQRWRIEVEDGAIRTFIDGKAVFGTPVEDRTLEAGTVGLYAWRSENLAFDDIVVTMLEAPVARVQGTADSEFLEGGDGIDLIVSGGGAVDRIRAGAGLDRFDFTAIRQDAGRNIVRVADMEAGETIIGVDPDADIVDAAARGSSLHLTLAGDGDRLILTGVTAVDQLLWAADDSLV